MKMGPLLRAARGDSPLVGDTPTGSAAEPLPDGLFDGSECGRARDGSRIAYLPSLPPGYLLKRSVRRQPFPPMATRRSIPARVIGQEGASRIATAIVTGRASPTVPRQATVASLPVRSSGRERPRSRG